MAEEKVNKAFAAKTTLENGKFNYKDPVAEAKAGLKKTSLSGANSVAALRKIIEKMAVVTGIEIGE